MPGVVGKGHSSAGLRLSIWKGSRCLTCIVHKSQVHELLDVRLEASKLQCYLEVILNNFTLLCAVPSTGFHLAWISDALSRDGALLC